MNFAEKTVAVFEQRRPFLLGLAYRILGSRAEAEDAVQELFIKWLEADQASITTPAAWLTTACIRHCIDLLRSAHKSRVDYVGTWLPEPIHTTHHQSPEHMHELSASLSTAFLLILERLINGAQGVVIKADGLITASMTFGLDGAGRVNRIFIMRNPDKLAGLQASANIL
jgi:DNA-directed RNA polymerase specialized sigma24 family protein